MILVANSFIFLGALFIFFAALGVVRLPDIYTKMHAATKSGTLGCGLILIGSAIKIEQGHIITEVILLILFIAITTPISAHLIAKTAMHRNDSHQVPQDEI